jgi:hypothetical protein
MSGVGVAAANIASPAYRATPAASALTCPTGSRGVFGLCMKPAASGPVAFSKARTSCNVKHGRLPSLGELDFIATLSDITWANGMPQQYEFTSTNSLDDDQPVARDKGGNIFDDARDQTFWYHCLTMPLQN